MKSLWFIVAYTNPAHYLSRYNLYQNFKQHILHEIGGNLLTIEGSYQNDLLELSTDMRSMNEIYIGRQYDSLIWLKENLQNVAVDYLPNDAEYLCFVDADIQWKRPLRVVELIKKALDTSPVIQPWRYCDDLDQNGVVFTTHQSAFHNLLTKVPLHCPEGFNMHPGYALAMTKTFWLEINGLYDKGITGSGDAYMVNAFIGSPIFPLLSLFSQGYKDDFEQWKRNAGIVMRNKTFNVLALDIVHNYHGQKSRRGYAIREATLIHNGYDPSYHLVCDSNNIQSLRKEEKLTIEEDLFNYFLSRKEDE